MELAIFGQAFKENLRFKRVIPWFALSLICAALAFNWSMFQPGVDNDSAYGSVSSILVFHILALTSAILTSTIMSQEVENKTIVYLLTRPVPRWKLLLFRYLACSIVVTLLATVNAICVSAAIFHNLTANPLLFKDICALAVGAFAYNALFLFIGLLFNRGMIICLLFAFGWETAVPNMPGQMCYLSINSYLQAIAQHPSAGQNRAMALASSSFGDNSLTSTNGYVAMTILVLVLAGLSAFWFTNFEYLPREDAE